jgi:hypothetical protein
MTVKPGSIDSVAFAAEGMAGTAGAAALKKVRSLANAAPAGRAFAAIATLSELAQTAEGHLRAGKDALERGSVPGARKQWTSAVKVMGQMASEAHVEESAPAPDNPGSCAGVKPAFLTLHVVCVALSARRMRRRAAKSV